MLIEGTDPFATAKPDARLIKLLIRARRFNRTLVESDGVPFAVLAKREGVRAAIRIVKLTATSEKLNARSEKFRVPVIGLRA